MQQSNLHAHDTSRQGAEMTARILTLFESRGLRNTRPRQLIAERLAAWAASGTDFTAQDLWHELRETSPHLGRATVYRAVDLLLGAGLLDRVPFADGTHRYRVCGETHHHHLTCTSCQRVVEVGTCLSPDVLHAIRDATHFTIEGHSLELFGRCPNCQGN